MRIHDLIESATAAVALHNHRRMVYRELSAMGERELQDLGISRCDIPRIARNSHPRGRVSRPVARHGIPSTRSAYPA
ncbi:DUF1127 domain-containing protein [Ancylobacter terrae]|uniref:DUF1127 domain-containing protein n=1 Tax=Ancylobacter sp. sgz301288 TaxID=3342077 RepID=UPI003859F67B